MNDQGLLELARWAADEARRGGAREVRVSVQRSSTLSVEWRDGRLERVKDSTTSALGAALFVDGRYSVSSTSDLGKPALGRFFRETIAMTRVLARDESRVLPDPSRYASMNASELRCYDPSAEFTAADWLRARAQEAEDSARSAPGAGRIVSVSSWCVRERSESALVVSNGMEGTFTSSYFGLGCGVSVKDEQGRKPEDGWHAAARLRSKLPPALEVGRRATERALARVGSKPRRTGEYPCVVEAVVAGRLISPLWHALQGGNLQQRRSFLAGRVGETLASPLLTVVDQPDVPEGLGSSPFDAEGMATRPLPIFERGTLRNYYLDTYYGNKLDLLPTSAQSTNLVWELGQHELGELIARMGTGIVVQGFTGGNANVATGDFSLGVNGQWIENRKPAGPISEMNLSGNALSFWKRLVEVGNDPYPYAPNRQPSLRFDRVQFSGR